MDADKAPLLLAALVLLWLAGALAARPAHAGRPCCEQEASPGQPASELDAHDDDCEATPADPE